MKKLRIYDCKHWISVMLVSMIPISIFAQNQTVTLNLDNAPLKKVFASIQDQTGFTFSYGESLVKDANDISLNIQEADINTTLAELSRVSNLEYKVVTDDIILVAANNVSTPSKNQSGSVKAFAIKGTVLDENGEPIIGASIVTNGAKTGISTDYDGNFTIGNAKEGDKLTISYIGYIPKEVVINSNTPITIHMNPTTTNLEEVVVVGYGTQQKSKTTGSIAHLKADDISNIPVASFEQAIAGQLPGVQVMQQSGTPGKSATIKIRAASSITAGTEPLYVIDGFPTSSDDMSNLNPEDIASIDVLKDASSAAIYGSRGANGVIIITTKKGSEGKPKVTARAYYGFQQVAKKVDLMDAYEFANFVATARNNFHLSQNPANQITDDNSKRNKKARIPDYLVPYLEGQRGLINTDWQDEIFRTAPTQQYTLGVSGASERASYYISLDYLDQDGVIENTGFKRFGGRSNVSVKVNDRISVDFNVAPSYAVKDRVSEGNHKNDGVVLMTMIANPAAKAYNEDGSVAYGDVIDKGLTWGTAAIESPLATAVAIKDRLKIFNLLSNINLNVNIIKGLDFKSNLGLSYNKIDEDYFRPSTLGGYNKAAPSKATGKYWGYTTTNWVWENILTYNISLGQNDINLLGGISAQRESVKRVEMTASDYPNDNITSLNAGIVNAGLTTDNAWSLLSYFFRVNYSYANKYIVAASIRRDGSSRFGKNNKYGTFPSVSLGWRMIEENWMKEQNIFSDFKLKVSYGATGNFQIPNYSAYSLLKTANYIQNGTIVNGLYPYSAPNPEIGWEKARQWNYGIDMSFFHNRLSLYVDYYTSITDGLLLDVPVPGHTGFTTSLQNIGKVSSHGFEVTLNANLGTKNFTWTPGINFSMNKSTVKNLGPDQDQILSGVNLTKVGGEVGEYYVYNVLGVFRNQEELDTYPHQKSARIGSYKYEDVNDDGKIDDSDRKVMGSYHPDFTVGFNNSFRYRDFDLSFMMQWVQGVDIFNQQNSFLLNEEGWGIGSKRLIGNWFSAENPNARYAEPSASPADKLYETSNYMIEDGSYLKITNITFGYSLPKKLLKRCGIDKTRFYFTAHNPFTFTKYSGYNPEVSSSKDPLCPGIDYGGYPVTKSYVIGLSLTF